MKGAAEIDIPRELIEEIQSGNVILFVGELLSYSAGIPALSNLMAPLARALGMHQAADPQKVADAYEVAKGRRSLIQHLRTAYAAANAIPSYSHSLLAALPIQGCITTNLDGLLEQGLQMAQVPYQTVVRPEDLAFLSPKQRFVVKLFGDITRPETVIFTTKDFSGYPASHEALITWLKGQLFNKTLLFVGYSMENAIFSQLRSQISYLLQGFQRMSFAIFPDADDYQIATLRQDHIQCIGVDDTSINQERVLEEVLQRMVQECLPTLESLLPIDQLTDKVRQWLHVLGYTITLEKRVDSKTYDIRAEIRVGLLFQRVLVRCFDGEMTVLDLKTLEEVAERDSISTSWGISERRVPPSSLRYAEDRGDALEVFSLDDFIRRIVDLSPYFGWLEETYQESDIPKYYVPLGCEKPVFDDAGRLIAADKYSNIEEYIDDWLNTNGRNHISILGNFGSGKTWFCRHYAYRQLQRYMSDPGRHRIPLLISLRDYSKTADMRQLITDLLINRYEVKMTGGFSVFQLLNKSGKILLIFDGFDEMARKMDQQTLVENFWRLAEVVDTNSKVILTCRTAYFRYRKEAEEILSGQRTGRTLIDLAEKPEFEIVNLSPFNQRQIAEFLVKRLGEMEAENAIEKMDRIHDLSDLARRPVMLEMIASTMGRIIEQFEIGTSLNVADLYRLYVEQWITKNIVEERTFLDPASKQFFMQELAWQLYKDESTTIHYSDLPERILRYFDIDRAEELDYFDYDLRTQGFLIRNADGQYSFAHNSFMEYFVACYLLESLRTHYGDSMGRDQKVSAPDARQTFGFRRLTPEVETFFVGLRPEMDLLWSTIETTRGKSFDEVGYLGSNAASILTKLNFSFSHKDLSKTVLRDANLTGADLSGANCREIDGEGLNLQFCNLTNADFSFSELHHVMLGDSDVVRYVGFSPDSSRIIYAGSEPAIKALAANSGKVVHESPSFVCTRYMAFGFEDTILVGAGLDGVVRIWDVASMQLISSLRAHMYPIYGIACDPLRGLVATASSDHTVKVWDIRHIVNMPEENQRVRLWDVETVDPLEILEGHPHHVRSVVFSPSGKWLISVGVSGEIKLWDATTWRNEKDLTSSGGTGPFQAHFSADGKYLAVGFADGSAVVWSTDTWKQVAKLAEHPGFVLEVAFHPNSDELAVASRDGTITIWKHLENPIKDQAFKAHSDALLTLQYHPNGKLLLMGGGGNVVKLWDLSSKKQLWEYRSGDQRLLYQGMNITGVRGIIPHFLQFLRDNGAVDEADVEQL